MIAQIPMWTIYERPRDFPDKFVVRLWECLSVPRPLDLVGTADSLWGARKLVPPGRFNLGRQPGDDPVITETWI